MAYPEPPHATIDVADRASRRERMHETAGIEVEAHAALPGEIDPWAEVREPKIPAVHPPRRVWNALKRVDVQPKASGYQRDGEVEIGKHFVGRSRSSGPRAGRSRDGPFPTADVIELPTVEGYRNRAEPLDRALRVNPQFPILLPYFLVVHSVLLLITSLFTNINCS